MVLAAEHQVPAYDGDRSVHGHAGLCGPAGPLVGHLIGGALIDPGTGPVQAIDVSVVVDGEVRSVWRRQSDVMKWYVPVGVISPKECRWTSPNLLPDGQWQPTSLEIGLDVRLWHRLFGGWTPHHGPLTTGTTI